MLHRRALRFPFVPTVEAFNSLLIRKPFLWLMCCCLLLTRVIVRFLGTSKVCLE
jgi:hypothetical protein